MANVPTKEITTCPQYYTSDYVKALELIISMANDLALTSLVRIAQNDPEMILTLPESVDFQIKNIYEYDHVSFVRCVRFYRSSTGCGVKEATQYVENLLHVPKDATGTRVYHNVGNGC